MKDEATPEQLAMARRIVADTIYHKLGREDVEARRKVLNGDWDTFDHVRSALAAIIETQRLDAALAESRFSEARGTAAQRWVGDTIATAIRAGKHYGKDTDQ